MMLQQTWNVESQLTSASMGEDAVAAGMGAVGGASQAPNGSLPIVEDVVGGAGAHGSFGVGSEGYTVCYVSIFRNLSRSHRRYSSMCTKRWIER